MRKLLNYIKGFSPIFALILMTVFISFSMLSCENSFNEVKTDVNTNQVEQPAVIIPSNKGAIKIGITVPKNQNVRTAMPEMSLSDLRNIKLTGQFKGNNYQIASWYWYYDLQNDTEAYCLEVGTWNLTLSAEYNGYSFSDTKSITVTEGLSQNVNFKLSSDTTTGGLIYTINTYYEKTIDHADYEIKKYPSGDEVAAGTLFPVPESIYYKNIILEKSGDNALANGTYRVVFKFYGGTGNSLYLNTYSEIIRITGGITTNKNFFLDLNSVYKITWHLDGGSLQAGDSLVEQYSIHSDYSQITFPTLTKNGYKWGGWYSNEFYSGVPVTAFPSNQTGDVEYWAKWIEGYKLSYEIVNKDNSKHYPVSDELAESYKLPLSHDEDADTGTDLTVYEITDGDTTNLTCMFYYDSDCTNPVSGGIIGASDIHDNTTIYIKPTIDHVYVSPDDGTDYDLADVDTKDNFPFNSTTPAKTVAYAKEWIGTGETNTIYVMTTLRDKADIEALSGTSLQRGALVKRYASSVDNTTYKDRNLIDVSSDIDLQYVTLDGGAIWGSVPATSSVKTCTNTGLKVTASIITVASNATLNMNSVIITNNDNTSLSGTALNISGTVTMQNCEITNCKASNGAAANVSGNLTITDSYFKNNYSTVNGGALVCGQNSNVSISSSEFTANEAYDDGGAIYNSAKTNPLVIDACYFENNINSSGSGGTNIYDSGYMKLAGEIQILDGDIFFDVPASNPKPIILDSTFTSSYVITIVPFQYNNTILFDLSNLNVTQRLAVRSLFVLDNTDYEITIASNRGIITQIPGTVTVTPGFPGTYKCGYTMVKKGNSGKIKLILKDSSDAPVSSSLINSLKVSLYETGDLIKTWTGTSENNFSEALNFDYPHYIDDPTDTSFYVEVSIKPSDTSDVAYSYDFWAENNGIFVTMLNVTVPSINFNSSTTLCADDAEKKSEVFIANRNITIESLIVSDHETTQAEYLAVMGENPSYFSDSPADGENQDKRPVDCASWYDVLVYCNKRSILEGLTPCYTIKKVTDTTVDSTDPNDWGPVPDSNDSRWNAVDCNFNANGYRLPTEAEWEYCARGGTLTDPQFTYSGTTDSPDNYAWHSWNSSIKTHEVKKKTANALGLYDMSGNLMEWCWDYFIYTIDNSTPATGPIVASSGYKRVVRDGSYMEIPTTCAVIQRGYHDPHSGVNYIGFRVVRTAQ